MCVSESDRVCVCVSENIRTVDIIYIYKERERVEKRVCGLVSHVTSSHSLRLCLVLDCLQQL